jgi:hypothetical protein
MSWIDLRYVFFRLKNNNRKKIAARASTYQWSLKRYGNVIVESVAEKWANFLVISPFNRSLRYTISLNASRNKNPTRKIIVRPI